MPIPICRVTPDEGLATIEAVRFRLAKLREELKGNPPNAKHLVKRINLLKLRDPQEAATLPPAKAEKKGKAEKAEKPDELRPLPLAYLLRSKSDIHEYSSRCTLYAS